MRKSIITLTAAALIAASMSMTAWAMTAQEVIAKTPTSYTAGTNSVYGPKLTQDQLNAVAQSVADFKNNYITDGMSNDQKIKAGNDYVKSHVSYIDWDKGVGANTAYALVTGQGACSGMTRGFIALMDSVDVKAYLIHASGNSHQWIMAEFDDGFAFIDIDANQSAGMDIIYHSTTHPYAYDTSAYPAVGSHSAEYGSAQPQSQTTTEGWKQDGNGWWYQNADGSYPVNQWKEINSKQYYFGGDGYMLTNTTTPDGYKVGADGAWIQEQTQTTTPQPTDEVHTKTFYDTDEYLENNINPIEYRTDTNGNKYRVLSETTTTFRYLSDKSNLNPSQIQIIFSALKYNPIKNTIEPFSNDGTAIYEPFNYDVDYNFKIPNVNLTGIALVEYCKTNNIMIRVDICGIDGYGKYFLYCYQ